LKKAFEYGSQTLDRLAENGDAEGLVTLLEAVP